MKKLNFKAIYVVTIIALFMQGKIVAQDLQYELIYSNQVNDTFQICIALPPSYTPETSDNFPVIYILDGIKTATEGNGFYGFFKYLPQWMEWGNIPEVIAIGVGYAPWMPDMRGRDYAGDPASFHSFLKDELIPYIDSKYPVDASNRSLMGYSLGGFFSYYTLMQYYEPANRIFKNILSVDGSMWLGWSNLEKAYRAVSDEMPVNVIFTTPEDGGNRNSVEPMYETLQSRSYKGLNSEYLTFPNTNHGTILNGANAEGVHWFFNHEVQFLRYTKYPNYPIALNANSPVFPLSGAVVPEGGIYSGTGVADNIFNPAVADEGDHIVTYTYPVGDTNVTRSFLIVVEPEEKILDPNVDVFANQIVVDGDFSDWDTVKQVPVALVTGSEYWRSNTDFDVDFRMAYDSAGLYLSLQITDDTAVVFQDSNIVSSPEFYLVDNVELFLDMDYSRGSAFDSRNDFQLRIVRGHDVKPSDGLPRNVIGITPSGYNTAQGLIEGMGLDIIQVETAIGYNVEIGLPWSVLTSADNQLSPSHFNNDTILGFSVQITDRDAFDFNDCARIRSVNNQYWGNPSTWGTLTLKGEVEHVVETGINSASTNSEDYTIYPNPAHNIIHLNGLGKVNSNTPYKILDVAGKIVQSGHAEAGTIHVSSLESGMYLLKVDSRDFYKKLIIK